MKRLLSTLCVALLGAAPVLAFDFEADGIYYDVVGDEASVAYKMPGYATYANVVTIPETVTYDGITYSVTRVGDYAFYKCSSLTGVNLPSSVTQIGEGAFAYCSSLANISLPSGVESIGRKAFMYCTALSGLTISDGVETIGDYAFSFCNSLTAITVPASVTSLGEGTFYGCSSLNTISVQDGNAKYDSRDGCNAIIETATGTLLKGCRSTALPSGVTRIGKGAFYGCNGLESVEIPASVVEIAAGAFARCPLLQNIAVEEGNTAYSSENGTLLNGAKTLLVQCPAGKSGAYSVPSSVTAIESSAFEGCSGLTSVSLPAGLTAIGASAFEGCSGLATISLPNGVESVEDWTLCGCSGLTALSIPSSVTHIGNVAFCGCSEVSSVVVPDGVTGIGESAFCGNENLSSVIIPASVESIGGWAFYNCDNLESVTNAAAVPQEISDSTFSVYGTLYVREDSGDTYASSDYWKNFTIIDNLESESENNLTFTDGTAYAATSATTYDKVTYTRTFNNQNWQALYVPFSMNYAEWCDVFDIAEIHNFIEYDDNEDGTFDRTYLVVLRKTSGSTEPNYPYVIRAKAKGTQSIVMTDRTLQPAATNSIDCSSVRNKYTFTGTYTSVTDMFINGYYALAGGSLQRASNSGVTLGPQRWYLALTPRTEGYSTKPQSIKIIENGIDDTEGLGEMSGSFREETDVPAFDLAGRMVSKKSNVRGVKIVNGRKLIR